MSMQELAKLRRKDARDLLDRLMGRETRLPRNGRGIMIQGAGQFVALSNHGGVFIVETLADERGAV